MAKQNQHSLGGGYEDPQKKRPASTPPSTPPAQQPSQPQATPQQRPGDYPTRDYGDFLSKLGEALADKAGDAFRPLVETITGIASWTEQEARRGQKATEQQEPKRTADPQQQWERGLGRKRIEALRETYQQHFVGAGGEAKPVEGIGLDPHIEKLFAKFEQERQQESKFSDMLRAVIEASGSKKQVPAEEWKPPSQRERFEAIHGEAGPGWELLSKAGPKFIEEHLAREEKARGIKHEPPATEPTAPQFRPRDLGELFGQLPSGAHQGRGLDPTARRTARIDLPGRDYAEEVLPVAAGAGGGAGQPPTVPPVAAGADGEEHYRKFADLLRGMFQGKGSQLGQLASAGVEKWGLQNVAGAVGGGPGAQGAIGSLGGTGAGAMIGGAGVVVGFIAAIAKGIHAVEDWSKAVVESQRHLAEFSPSMAAVMAQYDVRQQLRDMQQGEQLAPSAEYAAQASADLQDRTASFGTAGKGLWNRLAGFGATTAVEFMEQDASLGLAGAIQKALGGQGTATISLTDLGHGLNRIINGVERTAEAAQEQAVQTAPGWLNQQQKEYQAHRRRNGTHFGRPLSDRQRRRRGADDSDAGGDF